MYMGLGAVTPATLDTSADSGFTLDPFLGQTPVISSVPNPTAASGGTVPGLTPWLNANAQTIAIVAGVGLGVLLLMKVAR